MNKFKDFLKIYAIVMLLACLMAAVMAVADVNPQALGGPVKWVVIGVLFGAAKLLLGKA